MALYPESKELAAKLATQALDRIAPLSIAPNPQNIAVWYLYLSGRDPAIVRLVDDAMAGDQPLTDLQCANLYSAVLSSIGGQFDDAREAIIDAIRIELERAITEIAHVLKGAGSEGVRYAKALDTASGALRAVGTGDQLKGIISNLVEHTHRMVEQNRAANARLSESSDEIATLKARMAEVREEALKDPLTGLVNRRGFAESMAAAMRDAAEENTPLSLLMLDIDNFKQFNDQHGHQIGDQVICLVADCAKANIKGRDTASRYGGEEFAILLPNTNVVGAKQLAEQIRKAVANQKIVRKSTRQQLGTVTVSIGVAQFRPGESDEALCARADAALYVAKNGGRNQVKGEAPLRREMAVR